MSLGYFIDNYSKFLIGNINFFNYVCDELLNRPKINSDLILKVQRRIKVLKLIDDVHPDLYRYYYGEDFKEILDSLNAYDRFDSFIYDLLDYREFDIETKVTPNYENELLKNICSKTYMNKHNYEGEFRVLINLKSDELLLEDYSEDFNELYFIIGEISSSYNLNFKIYDICSSYDYYMEDRIHDFKTKWYVNTNITILKIKSYNNFILKEDLDQFILERMCDLDDNPVWRYYLLKIKLQNNELSYIIENLCYYIRDNYKEYSYLDEDFYNDIALYATLLLINEATKKEDEENFNKYIKDLEDFSYDKVGILILKGNYALCSNNNKIDRYVEDILINLTEDILDNKNISELYKILGCLYDQKGDYIKSSQSFYKSGDLINYINNLGNNLTNLTKSLYLNSNYADGMLLTSKITTDHDFISYKDEVNVESIFDHDYSRLFTLELCGKEIYKGGVKGSVAELGVFRGDFASIINRVFPDRKLYLFDTFKSFDDFEVDFEKSKGLVNPETLDELKESLKQTSVEYVLSKMKYRENVIVKEGYFPDSINGLEEEFSFVSIDTDLYIPILNGLKYFYPRLSPNGYIFIHDYNHKLLPGISQAISDFEQLIGHKLLKVPLSDQGGTLVITKH